LQQWHLDGYITAECVSKVCVLTCAHCLRAFVCVCVCVEGMVSRPQAHLEHTERHNQPPWFPLLRQCHSSVNHRAPPTHKSAARTTHQRPFGEERGRLEPPRWTTTLYKPPHEGSPVLRRDQSVMSREAEDKHSSPGNKQ